LSDTGLIRWLLSILVPAAAAFSGVIIGAWLSGRREKLQRRYTFLERQLREFYSPLLGLRGEIRMRGELRVRVHEVANAEWQAVCRQAREAGGAEALRVMEEQRWKEFERVIEYDDKLLAEDLIPAYRKMLETFRGNFWLAEPQTLTYFRALSEFVDLWERWLAKSLPVEVVRKLQHSEANLAEFYAHIESMHAELRDRISRSELETSMPLNRKVLAREWLYFVVSYLLGVLLFPALVAVTLGLGNGNPSVFYEALFRPDFSAWIFTLVPYLFVQLVRSVIWAVKTLRRK